MKILLQDTETGLYLSRGGCWSDDPDRALAFLNEDRAKDFAIYHHLPNAKVVLRAETGGSEMPPTTVASAAKTNMNTKTIMNAKDTTTQRTKPSRRKVSRLGSAKAVLPAQPIRGPLEEKTQVKPAPENSPRSQIPAPAEPATIVEAKIDVGLGNLLFIRGQGDGLSWDKGLPLNCIEPSTWVWSTNQPKQRVVFKLLLNDQVWAKGEDVVVEVGRKIEVVPLF